MNEIKPLLFLHSKFKYTFCKYYSLECPKCHFLHKTIGLGLLVWYINVSSISLWKRSFCSNDAATTFIKQRAEKILPTHLKTKYINRLVFVTIPISLLRDHDSHQPDHGLTLVFDDIDLERCLFDTRTSPASSSRRTSCIPNPSSKSRRVEIYNHGNDLQINMWII